MNPTTTPTMVAGSLLLLLLSLIHPAIALNNVLLTGETLGTDHKLSYGDSTLVMQSDCNLVLYSRLGGFQSNTAGRGTGCTLTLNNRGSLLINHILGFYIWSTPSYNGIGDFAAVLRPDERLAVYGPSVWATPRLFNLPEQSTPVGVGNTPMVSNLLFNDQILYGNGKLTTKDYTFVMKDDCNLVLEKAGHGAVWQSGTSGRGTDCFARLDRRGRINILTDEYAAVWNSGSQGVVGEYMLMLQDNGRAVIYGPIIWITTPPSSTRMGEREMNQMI